MAKKSNKEWYVAVGNHGNHVGYHRKWNLIKCNSYNKARTLCKEIKEEIGSDCVLKPICVVNQFDIEELKGLGNRLFGDIFELDFIEQGY